MVWPGAFTQSTQVVTSQDRSQFGHKFKLDALRKASSLDEGMKEDVKDYWPLNLHPANCPFTSEVPRHRRRVRRGSQE